MVFWPVGAVAIDPGPDSEALPYNNGDMICERAIPSGIATMTGSPGPRIVFTQRHAAHLQTNGQFLLINGEERQIHSADIAFPDGLCGQVHASDAHGWLGASDGRDNMGGGDN